MAKRMKSPLEQFESKTFSPNLSYLNPNAGINGGNMQNQTNNLSTYNPNDFKIENDPKGFFDFLPSIPKTKHYKSENGKYLKDANGNLIEYTDEEWNNAVNKNEETKAAKQAETDKWREENKAPDKVFGDDTYEYWKKRMENESGKNYEDNKLLGDILYALDAPNRWTPTNRILDTAQQAMVGDDYYKNPYNKDTGNKLANAGLDLAGNMLGLGAMPTGDGKTTMLNFSDDIAAAAGKKLAEKTGSNFLGAVTRGAVDGAVGSAGQNIAVKGGQDIEDDMLSGAIGGGAFFGAGNLLGKGISKIKAGNEASSIGLLGKEDTLNIPGIKNKPSLDVPEAKSDLEVQTPFKAEPTLTEAPTPVKSDYEIQLAQLKQQLKDTPKKNHGVRGNINAQIKELKAAHKLEIDTTGINTPTEIKAPEIDTTPVKTDVDIQLEKLKDEHLQYMKNINDSSWSAEVKGKRSKAEGYKYAAAQREIIQGDSLDIVPGGLTPKELNNKINSLNSNYVGKEVETPLGIAKIKSTPYGKVNVEFADGSTKLFTKEEINSKQYKIGDTTAKTEAPKIENAPDLEIPKVTLRKEPATSRLGNSANTPLVERTLDNVKDFSSDKSIKAIEYDYPELQPYIQDAAKGFDFELRNSTIKGESQKGWTPEGDYNGTFNISKQAGETVTKAQELGMTYKQMEKAAQDLIHDKGRENNANAKKLEAILDDDLVNGTVTAEGYEIPANKEYKEMKEVISFGEDSILQEGPKTTEVFSGLVKDPTVKQKKTSSMALDFDTPLPKVEKSNVAAEMKIDLAEEGIKNPYDNLEPGQDISKTVTNTYRTSEMLDDPKIQKVVDDINEVYDVKSNEQSLDIAAKKVETDFEGIKEKLTKEGINSAEDSAASALITKKLKENFLKTGDSTELYKWLETVRPQVTNLAQTLQAFSIWKKISPEGTLMRIQKTVDSAKEQLKTDNPTKYKKMEQELSDIKKQLAEMQKKAKTATESNKIAKKEKNLISEVKKKYGIPDFSDAELKEILTKSEIISKMPEGDARSVEEALLKKAITDKLNSSFADKVKAYQRMNLLLNTKTMTRNVLGNVGMMALENIKDIPGALLDRGISKLTKTKLGDGLDDSLRGIRTTDGLSLEGIKTQGEGLVKGFKKVNRDHKLGINTSATQGQYELPQTKAFKGEGGVFSKALSKFEDMTSTGLRYGDEPFYQAKFDEVVRQEMKRNNVTEPTSEMFKKAAAAAEDITFQNNSKVVEAFKRVQGALNLGKEFGLGNIVMPFVKTPANIIAKGIDYSPIGGVQGLYKLIDGMKKGTLNQKAVVDKLSRGLTGTTLISLGMYLSDKGIITGSGPKDYEAQQLEKQSGKTPYSLKIGDKYYTLDWAQPTAIPIMIGADITQNKKEGQDTISTITDAIKSGGSTILNQSLLQGVANLFGGYSSDAGQNIMEGLKDSVMQVPAQFVPLNSALKQVNDFTDPISRETYSDNPVEKEWNKIKAKLPGLSNTLPEKKDTMGNTTLKYPTTEGKGAASVIDKLFNPGKISDFLPSNSEKVALELYNESGATSQMPRLVEKKISYNGENGRETINLTAEEISAFQQFIGQATEETFSNLPSNYYDVSYDKRENYLKNVLTQIYADGKQMILDNRGIKIKEKESKSKKGLSYLNQ